MTSGIKPTDYQTQVKIFEAAGGGGNYENLGH